jgi:hypothetical protein
MKVKTNNEIRTVDEMSKMWYWMTDTFGAPEAHNGNKKRWTYGKDTKGFLGSDTIINGTWEIEWFDFRDDKDATMFILRWS